MYGVRCAVHGVRCAVHGVRCTVRGARYTASFTKRFAAKVVWTLRRVLRFVYAFWRGRARRAFTIVERRVTYRINSNLATYHFHQRVPWGGEIEAQIGFRFWFRGTRKSGSRMITQIQMWEPFLGTSKINLFSKNWFQAFVWRSYINHTIWDAVFGPAS